MRRDEQDLIRSLIGQPLTHAYSAVGILAGPHPIAPKDLTARSRPNLIVCLEFNIARSPAGLQESVHYLGHSLTCL